MAIDVELGSICMSFSSSTVTELTVRRENAVCEYHVHTAVQKGRAGRAEFTAR
jgi:hypothetical protein